MRRRTLSYQTILLCLILADLLCVLGAYAGAFSLRVAFPLPFTADLLPLSRLGEVNHPVLFLLATQAVLLYFFGFYDLHTLQQRGRLVTRVAWWERWKRCARFSPACLPCAPFPS